MSQYIVSARKYRPDSFESLIGQDNIVQTLKNSIIRNQLAHAYLFCGPRGVGKTSAARIFAKTINCANPTKDMEPCGECESCKSFQEGRSYCIHEMDAASNNSVEDIKTLIEQVNIPPQIGKYSVYIVDEVHMLSTSAFNAFLKTLEEPPAHAIFILATTEKHKIPSTILSRCQTFDFNRISVKDAVRNLRDIATKENIKIDDEALHIIAMKSDGAMRDALTIFDQTVAFCGTDVKYEDVLKNLNVLDFEYTFSLVEKFLVGDYSSALMTFDEILSKGFNALYFVSALSGHFRNLMVSKSGSADSLLELPKSLKDKYVEQASRCPLAFLFEALNVTTQCEAGYRASVNPRLHIEFALMKLCFMMNMPQPVVQNPIPDKVERTVPKAEVKEAPKTEVKQEEKPVAKAEARQEVKVEKEVAAEKANTEVSKATEASQAVQTSPAEQAVSQSSQTEQTQASQESQSEKTSQAEQTSQAGVSPAVESNAQTAEPKPRRGRRKAVAATAILSIDAAKQEIQGSNDSDEQESQVKGDFIPTEEAIDEAWKQMAEEYSSRPRLATAISEAELEYENKEDYIQVTFLVNNEAQRRWLEERLLKEIEQNIQRKTGSNKLRLLVGVTKAEYISRKHLTQKEKAQLLIKNNPEVLNLVRDMDLDV